MSVSEDVERVERAFGDPFDPGNPLGFRQILAADEAGTMFRPGEEALGELGLNLDFVPVALGGRLARLDAMVEVMRSVYRRDPCLGLGYGASSLIAGVNIWAAGDPDQQRFAADLLSSGRRIAVAYHELDHGNDMAATECRADPEPGHRIRLSGRKEVVTNIERCEAFVLFARSSSRPGSRSHSQLLVDKKSLDVDRFRYLPRFRTVGMRGVELGGIEFDGCDVRDTALLGAPGSGLETALRSFQVTRTTLVSMFCGVLDTGLRTALSHSARRRLHGGSVADLPHVRAVIAGAYADLLAADCFATVATRALHAIPDQTAIYAQAVKFYVSKVLIDAMNDLSEVMGAHFYTRDGESAIFQKLLRDVQPAGFGHAARAACQVSLLPQLPLLARRGWADPPAIPDSVFVADSPLPPLSFSDLAISAGGREGLSSALAAGLSAAPASLPDEIAEDAGYFVADHRALADRCRDLDIAGLGIGADPETYALATRYVRVLVASTCFETWRRTRLVDPSAFAADERWLAAILHRLRAAAENRPKSLRHDMTEFLFEEAEKRLRHHRGFGFSAPPYG